MFPDVKDTVRSTVDGTMNIIMQQFPHLFPPGMSLMNNGQASEYGDDTLGDEVPEKTGLLKDVAALGPNLCANFQTLIEEICSKNTGKPYDDKTYLMERVVQLVASLPSDSKNREKLSFTLIENLWSSLQHPPLSFYSNKYMYRTADGSYNNVNNPRLGAAGEPYARTVRAAKALHGARPDPDLLFDLLMRREDGKFNENPAGISAVFFYHATMIVHDLFRSHHDNNGINANSSYLDLQVLYGNNQEAQNTIRTFKDGKLKPDAFADHRLLHQPPGACIYLVMFNRYHNWVVERLAQINHGGRFSIPKQNDPRFMDKPLEMQKEMKRRDEDLFQTARLITTSLYVNIAVGDYIRAINNISHSNSDWTLDPRLEIKPQKGFPKGVERGTGNACSVEFNLLYRFHAPVSRKDSAWMEDFFDNEVFKDRPQGVSTYDMADQDHLNLFNQWAMKRDKDPGKWTFGKLKRDPNTGMFDTAKMVEMFKSSIEDPAGAFGAHNVPKHLRIVEKLGILQARRWQVASLNEMREFFGLKRHETFEDINSDPKTADILRKLYEHPDMVELYPGLFVEDVKKPMNPGSAVTPPFTIGRAVLSDAVTLVRGDRFLTHDFTAGTLTPWGMAEVASNKKTLGGQMFYKLIQRSMPGYFKYDSVYCMQPMYTPRMTAEIARKFGTINDFSLDPPKPPPMPCIINSHAGIKSIMSDNRNFKVLHEGMLPTSLMFSDFCLSGDMAANLQNHQIITAGMNECPMGMKLFQYWFEQMTRTIIAREAFRLGSMYQVDVVKDVAQVVATHFVAEICNLPLRTKQEPDEALSEDELYKAISTFLSFTSFPLDAADAWNLRRECREQTEKLKQAIMSRVRKMERGCGGIGLLSGHFQPAQAGSLKEVGEKLTKRLLSTYSVENTACSLIGSAAGGMFLPHQFTITLDWFLRPENEKYWMMVKDFASQGTSEANEKLKKAVLEAQRLSSATGFSRVCVPERGETIQISEQGKPIMLKKGNVIICNTTAAFRDPQKYQEPNEFRLDRPFEDYLPYGWGPHICPGREIAMIGMTAMIKEVAKLGNFRRAPGEQGQLKSIPGPLGSRIFMDKTWSKFSPFASTMKVHFDSLNSSS